MTTTVDDEPLDEGIIRSSTVMAAGTVVSRVTGIFRTVAIAAAIGAVGPLPDAYATANTLPNILYILLVGGALNAVFIPQLVRHMTDDTDGGRAFADRLLTLTGMVLIGITTVAVLAAPWITRLYVPVNGSGRELDVAIAFAYLCLPQILFYGMFALYSQVLNARGKFGAPMFAPVLNNVVVIAGSIVFLLVTHQPTIASITGGQILLLGLVTTGGVVLQALVLIPVMRGTGYKFRPRFDLRGQGLGTSVTLAKWTIFFVAVNQVAFAVVIRLANSAGQLADASGRPGAGSAAYSNAHLMFILPHSIVTVSIITALLPRMSRAAHAGDLAGVSHDLGRGIRLIGAAMVPATVLFVLLGPRLPQLLVSYGNTSNADGRILGTVLTAFAVGTVPYSLYYVLLRGFYAMEDTKTPALVNIFLNVVNLAVGYTLFRLLPPDHAVAGLALGYVFAYAVTSIVLWRILSRRLGGLETYGTVRTLVRLSLAGIVSTLVVWPFYRWVDHHTGAGKSGALALVVVVSPIVLCVFVLVARRLRVTEVAEVTTMIGARLHR
jgi:putative peptidoglycan lipid II flippase